MDQFQNKRRKYRGNPKAKKIAMRNKRKKELLCALTKHNVELSEDSKLFQYHVSQGVDELNGNSSLDDLQRMIYLFDCANVLDFMDEAEQDFADELNAGYIPDCSVFQLAELRAMNKLNGNHQYFESDSDSDSE